VTLFLVDSNVLLDVVTDDPNWAGWPQEQLGRAAGRSAWGATKFGSGDDDGLHYAGGGGI
jgi:hypothetical protein